MNGEKNWIAIIGLTFTACVIVFGLTWSLFCTSAKQPLNKGDDTHWTNPQ